MIHSCEVKKWRIWVEADLFSLPKLAMTAWHNLRTGKMTCWYLEINREKKSSKIRNKIVKKIQKRINRNFLGLSYLDKAEGIKVSSIGSKVIEAAEASGRALKTLISANLTMRPDSKSISDPVAVEANLVSKAILVS